MIQLFILIVVVTLLLTIKNWPHVAWVKIKNILFPMKDINLFYNDSLAANKLFVKQFSCLPCTSLINRIDVTKAFAYIRKGDHGRVVSIYQNTYYEWKQGEQVFNKSILVLENKILVELGSDYAELLFANDKYDDAEKIVNALVAFKAEEKEQPFEINIITLTKHGLELKPLEINSTELNISLFYNDDFIAVDALIKERLKKDQDKGIILLHGTPGTGKTTYLRHLVGSLTKKVLFVSPSVASDLMNPDFIDLLINNPNSVLIIEDAENIIMDRKYSSNSSVSNLLNLSDGLLSDCLNVQIICTFNNAIEMVDSALMRKGRLIAKYEFGKLAVAKAQQLSRHLGFDTIVNKPMTLAEIANQNDMVFETKQVQVLGFRRDAVLEN